jgi:hypothetical protein
VTDLGIFSRVIAYLRSNSDQFSRYYLEREQLDLRLHITPDVSPLESLHKEITDLTRLTLCYLETTQRDPQDSSIMDAPEDLYALVAEYWYEPSELPFRFVSPVLEYGFRLYPASTRIALNLAKGNYYELCRFTERGDDERNCGETPGLLVTRASFYFRQAQKSLKPNQSRAIDELILAMKERGRTLTTKVKKINRSKRYDINHQ